MKMAKKQCDRFNENKYIYRKVLPMNEIFKSYEEQGISKGLLKDIESFRTKLELFRALLIRRFFLINFLFLS